MSLADMAEAVLRQAPDKAIWLGWSLGGLVSKAGCVNPSRACQALVTVASSPCFSARDEWPGIKPDVLAGFQQQLSEDFSARWNGSWRYKPWVLKRPARMRGR